MVEHFPAEPLHTLHLRVFERMPNCWVGSLKLGTPDSEVELRISKDVIPKLDNHMLLIQKYHPSEFNRPSRRISDMKH